MLHIHELWDPPTTLIYIMSKKVAVKSDYMLSAQLNYSND